jgi:protein gp37
VTANTHIQWTDATVSPLRVRVKQDAAEIAKAKGYTSLVQIAEKMAGHVGPHCEHVSPGCAHCYSGTNNGRCLPSNGTGLPFDRRSRDLVDCFIDEDMLTQSLRWKKSKRIFLENQSDLFGEWVSDEQIRRVFDMMEEARQHTFQVLTKRPERMIEFLSHEYGEKYDGEWEAAFGHVWLGVSVENQETADERIPWLLRWNEGVHFVSYEPALGPVDFTEYGPEISFSWLQGFSGSEPPIPRIDWVIVGGESGPGARPCHLDWIRSAVQQCKAAGVACFVKQLGAIPVMDEQAWRAAPTVRLLKANNAKKAPEGTVPIWMNDRKGGDIACFPPDLQVREFPEVRF